MDAYLRRRANDPRYRLATADPAAWWEAYAGIEERPTIVAQAEGVPVAAKAESHPLEVARHNASKRCWKGYEATPGKEAYSDGSCRKKGGGKKEKKKRSSKSRSRSRSRSRSSSSESDGEGGRRKKTKASDKK